MKKFLSVLLSALCALTSLCFVGCKNEKELLPSGHYGVVYAIPEDNPPYLYFEFTKEDIRDSHGFVIDGNTAAEWVSSCCYYKAKIVEKDGQIYLEGYLFRDFLDILLGDGEKKGSTKIYAVKYNEANQSFSLTPVATP